jgi:hypothetical protein
LIIFQLETEDAFLVGVRVSDYFRARVIVVDSQQVPFTLADRSKLRIPTVARPGKVQASSSASEDLVWDIFVENTAIIPQQLHLSRFIRYQETLVPFLELKALQFLILNRDARLRLGDRETLAG